MNKKIISLVVFLVALLICGFLFLQGNKKEFHLTEAEQQELVKENLPLDDVLDWAEKITPDIMTFGYNDHFDKLKTQQNNFTPNGWTGFKSALARANIIEAIEENLQIITARALGDAKLVNKELIDDRFQWVLELPIGLSYEGENGTSTDEWLVRLVIVRVPESHNPKGIAIAQWIATPNS